MKIVSKGTKIPILLFATLLSTDVSVQIFEKLGAASAGHALGDELSYYLRLLQLPWTWLVIVLSIIQLLIWSKILSKTDLSVAYPISSLCFPLTMIASAIFFHDHISWTAWAGGLLITLGIGIVGTESEHSASSDLIVPTVLTEQHTELAGTVSTSN